MSKLQDAFASARDKTDKSLEDLIPLAAFEEDVFRFQDGSYMDMVQIVTKDLLNMSTDALAYDNLTMANFYKSWSNDDLKLVSLNFPKSTKQQQKYFEHKIRNERNPVYRQFLVQSYQQLRQIEQSRSEREYYLLFFAKNREDLNNKQMRIMRTLGGNDLVVKVDPEKKVQILQKLNNKNTSIFLSQS